MSLRVKIEHFRAVESAEIKLDGISVLSGINGSGKSTIANQTYNLLSSAIKYEEIVDQNTWAKDILPIIQALFFASNNLTGLISKTALAKLTNELYPFFSTNYIHLEKLHAAIQTLKNALETIPFISPLDKKQNQIKRTRKIFESIIGNIVDIIDLPEIATYIDERLYQIEKEATRAKAERKAGLFQKFWKNAFGEGNGINPNLFNIYEESVPILDIENDNVAIPSTVKNVFYIDSPMALGENQSYRPHWNLLNNSLKRKNSYSDFDFTGNENLGLLNGSSNWVKKDNYEQFIYHRPDGKSFNLLECATGLKSFSILQMLYASGNLNDKTLLILDEPEAHLHPQWVVEYARLVIRLHKHLGVKFLIASHSPDFIRAIKHVSEHEFGNNVQDKVCFYLAESINSDSYTYQFKNCGLNISPIFKVFNKSLEKIDLYSGIEDFDA